MECFNPRSRAVQFLLEQGVHTLSQIQTKHFHAYQAKRQKTLAEKTLYTRLVIVKTFVSWCCRDGELLRENPLLRCKVRTPYTSPKFTPSPAQVNAILTKSVNPRLAQFATLAFSGLRVGELSMLRPQDVDLDTGWIHVVGREGWKPKTRQARKVPAHERLRQLLLKYAATVAGLKSRNYFFSDLCDGSRPINVRTINVELQALARQLKIPVSRKSNGLVVHSLRHYFETQAVDSGVPQFVVDQWMGHAGHAAMGRTYYGITTEKNIAFMKKVNF